MSATRAARASRSPCWLLRCRACWRLRPRARRAQPNASRRRPERAAGLLAEPRSAGADRSGTLEVRDKDKVATFSGNVKVVQGDTTMRCKSLVVFYEDSRALRRGDQERDRLGRRRRPSQISRLEAKGGVIVTQKDQTATGDTGLFDMKANTVTLLGNVVVSQGPTCCAASAGGRSDHRRVARSMPGKSHGPVRMLIKQDQGGPAARPSSVAPKLTERRRGRLKPQRLDGVSRSEAGRRARRLSDGLGRRRVAATTRRAALDRRVSSLVGSISARAADRGRRQRRCRTGALQRATSRAAPSSRAAADAAATLQQRHSTAHGAAHAEPRRRPQRSAAASRTVAQPSRRQLSRRACGREELRRPQGGEGREPLRAPRRGGRPARSERRRQDHDLLHDHRADRGRQRPHRARRPRRHRRCRCTSARGSASAICRRRRRSSAASTVEENIRAVLEVVEPNKRRRERELDALLEEFNITRLRKTPSIALSGGERRRVEIARALASRPNYMLLDEPFAGIDPIAVGDMQMLVRHLTNRGIGVLITDHNVRETLRPDRPRLHHLFGRGADGGPHRGHREQPGGPPALSRRGIQALKAARIAAVRAAAIGSFAAD